MKRKILIWLLIFMIITIVIGLGIFLNRDLILNNENKDNQEEILNNNGEGSGLNSSTNNTTSQEIYYIYDQTFMGSFQNNTWYSSIETKDNKQTKKWKYRDFLKTPFFTVYNTFGNSVDLDLLKTTLRPGIGCFFPLEHIKYENEFKKHSIYNKYTEIDSFFLPVTLSGEIRELETDFVNATIYFDNEEDILMTNQNAMIKFAYPQEMVDVTDNVKEYVKDYIIKHNLETAIDYTCTVSYLHDINDDNVLDRIYAFQSNDVNMLDYEKRISRIRTIGSFTLILVDFGDKIEIIYDHVIEREAEEELLETFQAIDRLDIIDINGDDIYECCFVLGELSGSQKYIAQNVNGNFKLILRNFLSN